MEKPIIPAARRARAPWLWLIVTAAVLAPGAAPAQMPTPVPFMAPTPTPLPQDNPWTTSQALSRRLPAVHLPPGEQLVGIVDHRYLTRSQLDERVNRMMAMTERNLTGTDARVRDAVKVRLEDTVLFEWAQLSLLAVHAEDEGHTASPEEVERKLQEIYQAEHRDEEGRVVANAQAAVLAFGISREELVGYVRDAILIEKMIQAHLARLLTEEDLRRIYTTLPRAFTTAPMVRLNYICKRLDGKESLAMRRQLKKEMESWRDKASKAARRGRFMDVVKEFVDPQIGHLGGDFGWTTAESLPLEQRQTRDGVVVQPNTQFVREIFSLKKGEVSSVLSSEMGFYVFQIEDQMAASGMDYESARPRVENAMYEEYKERLLQTIVNLHNVYLNARGLDLEAIQSPKSAREIAEEREERRKEQFMRLKERHMAQAAMLGLPTEADPKETASDPFAISEKSLNILRRRAEEDPQRLATPLPNVVRQTSR